MGERVSERAREKIFGRTLPGESFLLYSMYTGFSQQPAVLMSPVERKREGGKRVLMTLNATSLALRAFFTRAKKVAMMDVFE